MRRGAPTHSAADMTNTTTIMPFSARVRRSPFFERSHAAGAKSYVVYNHMLLPGYFTSHEVDYHHLKSAVQLWDVGCERQVEVSGPDALRLVQMMTPRDVTGLTEGQCYYIPTVDADGGMTNDPVLLRVGPERYWLSLSDSDLLLYCKALAGGLGLDVRVHEPHVAPLGIQGPKADELVRRVWGEDAASIGYFRFCRVDVNGTLMVLARSGFSLQGGYELYFEGLEGGDLIWDQLMDAGRDIDVRAGSPSQIERIEGGLLSYLTDMTQEHTPFEAGLGKFCTMDRETCCLAHAALLRKAEPVRQIRPVEVAGARAPMLVQPWPLRDRRGLPVGWITSCVWSPDFARNVSIAMVDRANWEPGTELVVETPDGLRSALVKSEFWGRT